MVVPRWIVVGLPYSHILRNVGWDGTCGAAVSWDGTCGAAVSCVGTRGAAADRKDRTTPG